MRGRGLYLGYYLDNDERERTVSWLLPGYLGEGEARIFVITCMDINGKGRLYLCC